LNSYAHLLSSKKIQALVVKDCQLSTAQVLHPVFDTIRALDLSSNKLTDLNCLSSAYQLKGLWLCDCGLSDFKAIMTLVRKLKFLEIFDLRSLFFHLIHSVDAIL
jgi:Leucine-rich repeat (LRR) protein